MERLPFRIRVIPKNEVEQLHFGIRASPANGKEEQSRLLGMVLSNRWILKFLSLRITVALGNPTISFALRKSVVDLQLIFQTGFLTELRGLYDDCAASLPVFPPLNRSFIV